MSPSSFLEQLLDESRSEKKRVGGSELSLAHLAIVVCRRSSTAAEQLGPIDHLISLVDDAALTGEDRVIEFVNSVKIGSSQDLEPIVAALAGLIGKTDASNTSPVAEASPLAGANGKSQKLLKNSASKQAEARGSQPWLASFGSYVDPAVVLGRQDVVDAIVERVGRAKRPVAPMLVGLPGSGRTAILGALAHRLRDDEYRGPLAQAPIFRINSHSLVGQNAAESIWKIASSVRPETILCIDDFEVAAGFGPTGADFPFLRTVRKLIAQGAPRFVFIINESYVAKLSSVGAELEEEIEFIAISTLGRSDLKAVVASNAAELEIAHQVKIPTTVREIALAAPTGHRGPVHPGLAIERMDRACVRARMSGRHEVTDADFQVGDSGDSGPLVADALVKSLTGRIKGQDAAVRKIAERLALTKSGLDLRPNRPDGVFLLVGPTGVGKTEVAKALARELLGAENAGIRLDMSEYYQEWAISRIIGPPPGYVGATEPSSWLTTRVLAQPEAIVLLDEFEKSHPQVWNTFLQVFDDGVLTDSLGRTVDFSQTVFLLTSNLGTKMAAKEPMGFGRAEVDPSASDERMLEVIRSELAPELLNRLDDVIIFRSLDMAAITQIAAQLAEDVILRSRVRGYELEIDLPVIEHLAVTGYDPGYGARHLQRNLERLLLEPLLGIEGNSLRACLVDGAVQWIPK